jgi:ubiquinone/menaquinone biosynthesis C-methylase UbiE
MKSLNESVVTAMDGSDELLFDYLPYILQDIWELGASPSVIIKLIKKHKNKYQNLKVLDLGCGKGAVSVQISKELNCSCFGIDAVKEFIDEANKKAREFGVEKLCNFKVGDIRLEIINQPKYDIIILGAIGPILGDYEKTLITLKNILDENGLIIIDDAYLDETINKRNSNELTKSLILENSANAGMKLIDEHIMNLDDLQSADNKMFQLIKERCEELIIKEPGKKKLFEDYIQLQKEENKKLENKLVCSTMVFGNN